MTLVIDASVAVKWVLPEAGAAEAESLRSTGEELIAPDLLLAEVGSTLWKHVRRQEITRDQAMRGIGVVHRLMTRLYPPAEMASRALTLAIELDHPIYDCFYLVLAERERAPIVSADRKLVAAGKRVRGIKVTALSDI